MSSHHFVRDKQEPALMIANGEACNEEVIGQLLEWNPFVLVLDGALERVLQLGIKIDAVLGDFDHRFPSEEWLGIQEDIRVVHTPDQEFTDFQKGIEFLIAEGFAAVNIIWATGKRADHSLNNMSTLALYKGRIDACMIDNHSRIYNLPNVFKKWYLAETNISLFPMPVAENIYTSNLWYNLQGESLQLPYRTGSSNRVKEDGWVEISYGTGQLIMMECFD